MGAYIDLIEKLTDADKATINAYVEETQCSLDKFIGIEQWLQSWSHSKQKLYKLLGNQFIKKIPYVYEKERDIIRVDFLKLLREDAFKANYHNFYNNVVILLYNKGVFDVDQKQFFNHLMDADNFVNDKIAYSLKYKPEGAQKMLQISVGTKPIRAIGKVIDYFKDVYDFDKDAFEEFKKKHSLVLNDKTVSGMVNISIHPLDFMTMSDNQSNWSSCMNWKDHGCYHVGTVEMMNSNNVVCCYLDNPKNPFYFKEGQEEAPYIWNNKKWRQLFYVTKDIIMSGTAYPYENKETSLFILDEIKKLAIENLNWSYDFGPELYQDMKYVYSNSRMENQRKWMRAPSRTKNNIIWDTKGMYNDMLNKPNDPYYCYRNKVNNTKIYSVSGKAPCLVCGKQVIKLNNDDRYEYYNDRYSYTGQVICHDCIKEYSCDFCNKNFMTSPGKNNIMTFYNFHGYRGNGTHKLRICLNCIKQSLRICPCCGKKNIYTNDWSTELLYAPFLFENNNKILNDIQSGRETIGYFHPSWLTKEECDNKLIDAMRGEIVSLCNECQAKVKNNPEMSIKVTVDKFNWYCNPKTYYIITPQYQEKFRFFNAEVPKKITEDMEIEDV